MILWSAGLMVSNAADCKLLDCGACLTQLRCLVSSLYLNQHLAMVGAQYLKTVVVKRSCCGLNVWFPSQIQLLKFQLPKMMVLGSEALGEVLKA